MTKKSKKLGVKTTKPAVFDESFEDSKPEKNDSVEENKSSDSKSNAEKDQTLDQICSTIDKLSLDMFILMQQHMRQKLNIEKCMTDGELHLSKSRYIMGLTNVSALQIPTESNVDIDPSVTIEEIYDDEALFGKPRLNLVVENFTKNDKSEETSKETNKETEKNIQDPIKWFGVLVPRDLRSAQSKFRDTLTQVVDCANIQTRLHETCVKIKQLTKLKQEMLQKNEE